LLVKLKLFTIAEAEAEPFGDLERPDVFLQYYPEMYGGRRGSLAPWRMRLIIAQIPGFCGKCTESVNRLFRLLECDRAMIRNLKSGLLADGSVHLDADNKDAKEALDCWEDRERQVVYALVNCCINGKDYESAVKCLDILLKIECRERKASLYSAYGRLYLQVGSLAKAEKYFKKGSQVRNFEKSEEKIEDFLDKAALEIGKGDYEAALKNYGGAVLLCQPGSKHERLVKNNQAVCLLYLGRLKEGVNILETAVTSDPQNTQGNPMLNLCTLYELESSYALQKKIGMLGLVSLQCPDSFPTSSLKL
jgi:tetratricopeptide (TPR) repeat protein